MLIHPRPVGSALTSLHPRLREHIPRASLLGEAVAVTSVPTAGRVRALRTGLRGASRRSPRRPLRSQNPKDSLKTKRPEPRGTSDPTCPPPLLTKTPGAGTLGHCRHPNALSTGMKITPAFRLRGAKPEDPAKGATGGRQPSHEGDSRSPAPQDTPGTHAPHGSGVRARWRGPPPHTPPAPRSAPTTATRLLDRIPSNTAEASLGRHLKSHGACFGTEGPRPDI